MQRGQQISAKISWREQASLEKNDNREIQCQQCGIQRCLEISNGKGTIGSNLFKPDLLMKKKLHKDFKTLLGKA